MSSKKINSKGIIGAVVIVVLIIAVIAGTRLGKTPNASPSASTGGAEVASTGVSDDELFPLRTNTRKDCTLAPVLVADKLGFFKEEGLKLVFTGELTQAQILPSVLNGNNDFSDGHPNDLALKINGGANIIGVERSIIEPPSSVDKKLRHMRYYVNESSGIKNWDDLKAAIAKLPKGKTLKAGGWPSTCEDFVLNNILDKNGIQRSSLEWTTFETDLEKIQALKQGLIDITLVHPPFFDAAAEAGLIQIGDSSDSTLGEAAGTYLYYFTTDFVEEHPEQVKGFVRAMLKAQKWANAHVEETAKLTGDYIGIEVKGNHYYAETSKISDKAIQPWIDDLIKTGLIKEGEPGSKVSDVVTHEFEADE
ncbi:ABC transporter substrate-binding protein [Clostridium aminobutyricum]|uniref:ABC transporter substrate-binding protein n=1 Tax=Clostridium aminobutyricum TaxID=33953 RepID=A0A939D950_CLOAM|nr:ABC transporter substrate-binding protein [Clostridium aminobutyricum]MBN7773347.1 ABC transporter substrate-binding protein [Clostridium aminobutyricum]